MKTPSDKHTMREFFLSGKFLYLLWSFGFFNFKIGGGMKKFTLLLCLTAIIFAISNKISKAQVVYTDVIPDTTIFMPVMPSIIYYTFDLDNNGIMDYEFRIRNFDTIVTGQHIYGKTITIATISSLNKVFGGCWASGNNL
jgi:hypothetical protein